jgi:hypothetical protein
VAIVYKIGWQPERPYEGYDIHLLQVVSRLELPTAA